MMSDGAPVLRGQFPEPEEQVHGDRRGPGASRGDAVLLHLTGPHRGSRQHLTDAVALVGTSTDAVVHFPIGSDPAVERRHALLIRGPEGWAIEEADGQVYVNSADVPGLHGRETLIPGDILEIGTGGPVLRFVMESHDPAPYKSMRDAWRDCVDCARHGRGSGLRRFGIFLRSLPREFLTRTAPRTRVVVAALAVVVVGALGMLAAFGLFLERRIEAEEQRSRDIAEALLGLSGSPEEDPELRDMMAQIEAVLGERIAALEALSDAGRRVVTAASSSVLFVQGGYNFVDPDTDRPLRLLLGPDGSPRQGPGGFPLTTLEGDGPLFEAQFTGSAWLASSDGLLITNRHVAIPWSANADVRPLLERGLRPVLRLIAYTPDATEPVQLEFVAASRQFDLAVVRAPDLEGRLDPLPLSESNPAPGQAILVLGYPAGIDALLARSGAMFVDSLMQRRPDFWTVVQDLAKAGFIRPLASRGIVGQVTPSTVAYDAETTRGGSGGPVLSLDGEVVAVTFAVMAEFGGSNLGVPVDEIRSLIETAGQVEGESPVVDR